MAAVAPVSYAPTVKSMTSKMCNTMIAAIVLFWTAILVEQHCCHGFVVRSASHYAILCSKTQTSGLSMLTNTTSSALSLSDDDDFTQLSATAAAGLVSNQHTPPTTTKDDHHHHHHHHGAAEHVETPDITVKTSSSLIHKPEASPPDGKGRKLDLMWCRGREFPCRESIRERVTDNNVFEFEGPATGQVCFMWSSDDDKNKDECLLEEDPSQTVPKPSVLLLIKHKDEELLRTAAGAIKELTDGGIQVYLVPEIAAKIEHYYRVHNDAISLFEPRASPGFGGNHVPADDKWMLNHYEESLDPQTGGPDMICTLGGDGLLMHANVMFQGPVPPILCVAGGSMGFLTTFSKDEMVEAIRVSLGLVRGGEVPGGCDEDEDDPVAIKPYEALKQSNQYYNADTDHRDGGNDAAALPKFKFGLGNKICLSMRMRLECKVINREGVVRARFNVLNEVTVDRGSSPYLAALECFCDNVHLTTVQADGVIFATPTGSTAYSMAAGGSVVHPAVPAILVTPICPHVLSFRSMVFPDSVVLRCYVPDDARADASVAFDGRYRRILHRGDSVQIQMSQHPVPTINRMDHSADWLNSLKRNFNFNTRARQRPL